MQGKSYKKKSQQLLYATDLDWLKYECPAPTAQHSYADRLHWLIGDWRRLSDALATEPHVGTAQLSQILARLDRLEDHLSKQTQPATSAPVPDPTSSSEDWRQWVAFGLDAATAEITLKQNGAVASPETQALQQHQREAKSAWRQAVATGESKEDVARLKQEERQTEALLARSVGWDVASQISE